MSNYKQLITKVHILDQNYNKEPLNEKQEKILKLYDELCEELNDSSQEATVYTEINSDEYDVTIKISSSKDLLISEFDVSLNKLLFLADIKNIQSTEGNIVLLLWFRCWAYCKKETKTTSH